jgi:plasmid stabilization system protein ParE
VARSVVFREEAENDLTELALYIAGQSGAVVANRYLDRIYAACAELAHFPQRRDAVTISCRVCAPSGLSAGRRSLFVSSRHA